MLITLLNARPFGSDAPISPITIERECSICSSTCQTECYLFDDKRMPSFKGMLEDLLFWSLLAVKQTYQLEDMFIFKSIDFKTLGLAGNKRKGALHLNYFFRVIHHSITRIYARCPSSYLDFLCMDPISRGLSRVF